MRCIGVSLFLFTTSISIAQSGWIWGHRGYGTAVNSGVFPDYNNCDDSGNVYVSGTFQTSNLQLDNLTLGVTGMSDAFIAKYHPDGTVQWGKRFGGMYNEETAGIVADHFGNIFTAGSFNSGSLTIGSFTMVNSGGSGNNWDLYLAKFDANGNAQWALNGYDVWTDQIAALDVDDSGNVVVVGSFSGFDLTIGSTQLTNPNNNYPVLFIAKFDTYGVVRWMEKIYCTGYPLLTDVACDHQGNVIISGRYYSPTINFGSTVVNNAGSTMEAFLAKYDLDGNLQFVNQVTGPENEEGWAVDVDASNNIFLAGTYGSDSLLIGSTTLQNTETQYADVFLAKYDPGGNFLWAKTAGSSWVDQVTDVCVDHGGNAYIAGSSWADTIHFSSYSLIHPPASYPAFFAEYDPNGNVICLDEIVTEGNQLRDNLAADTDGNVYLLATYYNDTLFVANDTLPKGGVQNMVLAKYNCGNWTNVPASPPPLNISVVPNPAHASFEVKTETESDMELCDLTGRMLLRRSIRPGTTRIETGDIAIGIYMVRITNRSGAFSSIIILE